jgi:hypothetical protein
MKLQMTYEETGKAKAIEEKLTFLGSIIRCLELNADFPDDVADAQLDNVECVALDVFASIMDYLTNAIQHFSKPLIGEQSNTLGNTKLMLFCSKPR